MSCKNQGFMAQIKSYNVVWDPKCAKSQILAFLKALSHVTKQNTKTILCDQLKVISVVSKVVPSDKGLWRQQSCLVTCL